MNRVTSAEDVLGHTAVSNAVNHGSMVSSIREYVTTYENITIN